MIRIFKPELNDLWFRQAMLADEETMAYNRAWGGTIPFPEDRWAEWYDCWVVNDEGKRFYRYVRDESGRFVGEIAYHYDEELEGFMADVIIHAKYRGRGFGGEALELLCRAAGENGVSALYDDIAADNPAIGMFLHRGFNVDRRREKTILLKKEL